MSAAYASQTVMARGMLMWGAYNPGSLEDGSPLVGSRGGAPVEGLEAYSSQETEADW